MRSIHNDGKIQFLGYRDAFVNEDLRVYDHEPVKMVRNGYDSATLRFVFRDNVLVANIKVSTM